MSTFGDTSKISQRAVEFRKNYYNTIDNVEQRERMMAWYPDGVEGLMEWNGHTLSTKAEVGAYLSNLPPTKHHIECLDAQPLPGNVDSDMFVVTVNGRVVYNEEHSRFFYQRFVLSNRNGLYILNDYLRWTGESGQ